MVRQPWVAQIRNARNPGEQSTILRLLKNEIIGHPLKKELAVHAGVLDPVIRLTYSKASNRQDGKGHDHSFASRALSEEETLRLQGLQVLASIASGGPPFLAPLQSASPLAAIYSNLCPSSNPSQLVLAALRILSNLADASALASNPHILGITTLADGLFSRQNIGSLCRILSQTSASSCVQNQIALAASLISRLCRDERHQQGLANFGILDALATRLASFVAAEGLVLPGADVLAQRDGLFEHFPLAAPPNSNLAAILEAIATIIADSKFRASQLLYSPSIMAIFPVSHATEFTPAVNTRAAWNAFNVASLSARQAQLNAIDYLLPVVPPHQLRHSNVQVSAFPPLGTSNSSQNLASNGRSGANKYSNSSFSGWNDLSVMMDTSLESQDTIVNDAEEPESPLIAYLIYILRTRLNMDRLMAASVLTVLYRAGLTNKTREITIGLLVVPLLVNMLDNGHAKPNAKKGIADAEAVTLDRAIRERAPAILAMLITDSEYLQKAAFDSGVVGKLSSMLKVSYDPVLESSDMHAWSPTAVEVSGGLDVQQPRLGGNGQPPLLVHKIKVRESTLKAVAALVPFKDEYRKIIVEMGMMPYIVESMSPSPGKPAQKSADKPEKAGSTPLETESKQGYGTNPISVLVAACGAIRALSRSVSVLRTTLIDNGVAKPIFRLLQHPDIEVQISACATICNLLTDISPMRESISEAGVLKIICEHAHSMNAKLRLNAVWALKHFVHGVDNETKRLCLEELGQGWLVQLICDDTEDQALTATGGNGEQTHTPSDEMDEDVEMDHFEEQVDIAFGNSFGRSTVSRPSSSRSKSIQQADLRLATLRDAEMNPSKKARKDDIAVQEQGLDFIRNLIGGAGQGGTKETTEMIDFLFNALGQDRFFDILASKLKPRIINPYSRSSSPNAERKIVPPQSEIIIAVGYILVHMAASIPRHRQLVIAQTELLKLLVPQFNNPTVEVRVALCWLVTNLTWLDDQNDQAACTQRANELVKLGFHTKLEALLDHDPELNVRERAKSALWQLKQGHGTM